MKPSIAAVQSRLGIAVTGACAHDWRIKGKLKPTSGGALGVRYICYHCGEHKHEVASRRFEP